MQQLVDTPDGQGGQNRVWIETAALLGALEQLSNVEIEAGGGIEATGSHNLYVAFPDVAVQLDARSRLRYGTRIFDVIAVNDLGNQQLVLQLPARERFRQ